MSMADKSKQSIYESKLPTSRGGADGGAGSEGNPNPWHEMFRRSQRSFLIFRLIVLAFLILLSFLVVEQFQSRSAVDVDGPQGAERGPDIRYRASSVLNFDGDLKSQLIMDELQEMADAPIPEGGNMPLSAHWVKQVAYHLLEADNAYDREDWNKAAGHYNTALTIFPDLRGVESRLGLCYMRMENFNVSVGAFKRAVREKTNSYRLVNNLGVALLAQENYVEAEKMIRRALELNPDYLPAHYNLALMYYRTEMYEEARQHFETYFQENTGDIEALQIYSDVLIRLQRWDEAAVLLRKSAEILPQAPPVHFRLAQVMAHLGRGDEAMDSLLNGVELVDGPRALAAIAGEEFDLLRDRNDFKQLVSRLATLNE
jgi:tetratricopeptide (TPR) repeat protein